MKALLSGTIAALSGVVIGKLFSLDYDMLYLGMLIAWGSDTLVDVIRPQP